MDKDLCDISFVHQEKVQRIQERLETKPIDEAAGLFKALSDPTRMKIAYALTIEELCVCDVSSIIGVSVATASHHLRLLRDLGFATYRKEGKQAYYAIKNEVVKRLLEIALQEGKVVSDEQNS